MSLLTNKADLYDHVFKIGTKGTTDTMLLQEKFNLFKERTHGILRQNIKVKLTKNNIKYFLERDKDKLQKVDNGYIYIGKLYKTLASLNAQGFYTSREIHFNDMLELFPYLGHIIAAMSSTADEEFIWISEYDYNVARELERLQAGLDYEVSQYTKEAYKEVLQDILSNMK